MHNERNGRIMKLKRVISLLLSAVIFSAAVPSIADENSNGKSGTKAPPKSVPIPKASKA